MPLPHDGAVLVGGSSTRMGVDKATVDYGGAPLIEQPIHALARASHVVLIGGDPALADRFGLGWRDDPIPGAGPLGGVLSALASGDESIIVVLSCDLPFIDEEGVSHLVDALGIADVAVPIVGGRPQWTCAAWARSAEPIIARRYRSGARSFRECAPDLEIVRLFDTRPRRFVDVDTPDELAWAIGSDRTDGRGRLSR